MKLSNVQISELNACWNSVYRHIFSFNRWESVREFIDGIARMDFSHLRMWLQLKFCVCNLSSANAVFTYVMKRHYYSQSFRRLCHDGGLNQSEYGRFASLPPNRIR